MPEALQRHQKKQCTVSTAVQLPQPLQIIPFQEHDMQLKSLAGASSAANLALSAAAAATAQPSAALLLLQPP
jgi:hypothetical protein